MVQAGDVAAEDSARAIEDLPEIDGDLASWRKALLRLTRSRT